MRRTGTLVRAVAALALVAGAPAAAARKPAEPAPQPRGARLARVLALEDARSTADGELERLLRDSDRGVRRRAALAAGRIAHPTLVPGLIALMNDAEVEVRRMAAFALGLAGRPSAVDSLRAALGDPDAGVRGRAAEALGRIGDARAAPEIAGRLLASLPKTISRMTVRGDDRADPLDNWAEQRHALVALARLRDVASARQALLADGRPRFDWWVATWVAVQLGVEELRPVLVAAAASDDASSRALAARGLGAFADAAAIETLAPLVRDRNATVAAEALRALAAIGDVRGAAVAASVLDSPSDVVRREALRTLAALPPDRSLRPRLVSLVAERDAWVRAAALGALARTSPEDFALVLSGMGHDPSSEVRTAVASALGSVADEMSVGVLYTMLADEDPRVVASVLEALRRARGENALDTLRRHLEHPDLGVRARAAEAVAALGARGLTEALLAAWERGLSDGADEIAGRNAATAALARDLTPGARAALARIAREDPSRAARAQAAAALHDPAAEAVDADSALRPPLDYREAMAPYDPLPGVECYTPRVFLHTRKGTIEIQLDVVEAPLAAISLVALVRRGFYDGLVFHRVEPGDLVQGGSPRGDDYGGPGYTVRDEIGLRSFARGAVGLAVSWKDGGGSRFFITLAPQPQLDGSVSRVGTVAAGMEVVEAIRPGDVIERAEVWTGP